MAAETSIPWWNVDLGEPAAELVAQAVRQRNVSQGALTRAFEDALAARLGIAHAICVPSGTSALTMAFMALGIGPGDEVILPNRTWIATANAALILGAKLRLVDSRPDSMLMDEEQIEAAITPRTKAIAPVPLNGAAVDIDRVEAIAARHGLTVVEDSCQALFSRLPDGRAMGTTSRFGCFSLGMAKVLTTGAGGFVVCRDASDAALLRRIRNQGMSEYDLSERHNQPGGNFKFTDIQAAIGLSQMERIDARMANQRALFALYRDGLAGLDWLRLMPVDVEAGECPLRVEVMCADRAGFIQALAERGVGSCPQAPNLADFPFIGADPAALPRSRPYGLHNLVLPSGPDQPLANAERAIAVIRSLSGRFPPWRAP